MYPKNYHASENLREIERLETQISELSMIVRKLIIRLSSHERDIDLINQATNYLDKNGLLGNILRDNNTFTG